MKDLSIRHAPNQRLILTNALYNPNPKTKQTPYQCPSQCIPYSLSPAPLPRDLCETRNIVLSCDHVLLRIYFLVVVVFVVLSSAFLVVEVAFEVVFAVVVTPAAGALVVVALAAAAVLTPAAGALEEEELAPETLAEVARVVPEPAARVLEATELELELELPDPDDAVFQ